MKGRDTGLGRVCSLTERPSVGAKGERAGGGYIAHLKVRN
jgi:hypothetical protein